MARMNISRGVSLEVERMRQHAFARVGRRNRSLREEGGQLWSDFRSLMTML